MGVENRREFATTYPLGEDARLKASTVRLPQCPERSLALHNHFELRWTLLQTSVRDLSAAGELVFTMNAHEGRTATDSASIRIALNVELRPTIW